VSPPERLVYTWSWRGNPLEGTESLVTVVFRDLGGSTEVVLTHERLPDECAVELHRDGWKGCLDRLEALVT
jgi:uncharacterized protein YndB with AHSA1/START domain